MSNPTENFSPEDYRKKIDEDIEKYERQEKEAGTTALQEYIYEYFDELIGLTRENPLQYTDLLTSGLEINRTLPEQARRNMSKLHDRMRRFIEEMAQRIENFKYKDAEEAVQHTRMTLLQSEKTRDLVQTTKKIHISAQSMKVMVEVLINLNNNIVAEFGRGGEDIHVQKELIIRNALIVCETLDFALSYIRDFGLKGIAEIRRIHQETVRDIEAQIQREKDFQQRAGAEPELVKDAEAREKTLNVMLEQWDALMKKVGDLENETELKKDLLPKLQLRRENAVLQLQTIEIATVLKQALDLVHLVEATPKDLEQKLKMIRLSPDDLFTLVGVAAKQLQ